MIMIPENGELCRCGNRGCLETLVSESMVIRRARSLAGSEPEGILAQLLAQSTEPSPIESVFQAARRVTLGRLRFWKCWSLPGDCLSNLVNIFNPELIILGGMFAQGQDLILPVVRQTLRQAAFAGLGEKVKLATPVLAGGLA